VHLIWSLRTKINCYSYSNSYSRYNQYWFTSY